MKASLKATTLIIFNVFPFLSSRFILVQLEDSKPTLSRGQSINGEGKIFCKQEVNFCKVYRFQQ